MSDKQERYYVVSESELEKAFEANFDLANEHPARVDEIREAQEVRYRAEAACRARPVPQEVVKALHEEREKNRKLMAVVEAAKVLSADFENRGDKAFYDFQEEQLVGGLNIALAALERDLLLEMNGY